MKEYKFIPIFSHLENFCELNKNCICFTFSFIMQNALGYHGDRGLLSSLVDWIAGNATPSFIEGQSLTEEVMFRKASAVYASTVDYVGEQR